MDRILMFMAGMLLGCSLCLMMRCRGDNDEPVRETEHVTVMDTVVVYAPVPNGERVVGSRQLSVVDYQKVRRQVDEGVCSEADEVCAVWADSIGESVVEAEAGGDGIIELPVLSRHYEGADYEAWVSGPLDPRLDSVRVVRAVEYRTARPKRWHLGVSCGLGLASGGVEPYIGVGLSYSIIDF